jgi:hypothetical protein
LFYSKATDASSKRQKRKNRTFFELSSEETTDRKIALLYSDFTEWGLRIEKQLRTLKAIAIIAVILLAVITAK